jgi:hypothetical protein
MGRLIGFAIASAVVVAGTAELSAQGKPGTPPRGSPHPFLRLFSTPSPPQADLPPALSKGLRDVLRNELQHRLEGLPGLPSGTRCHIVVVPADPTIDRRFSFGPPATARFLIREQRTDHICR